MRNPLHNIPFYSDVAGPDQVNHKPLQSKQMMHITYEFKMEKHRLINTINEVQVTYRC
jgi:hypothetical protein